MTLHPCGSCPYRKNVASGVWAEEEYVKLPPYDLPTMDQPKAAFFCHQQNDQLCAGWVGCHNMEESLGLRLAAALNIINNDAYWEAMDYECTIPLWESGQAACDHGLAGIGDPTDEAIRVVARLQRKLGKGK